MTQKHLSERHWLFCYSYVKGASRVLLSSLLQPAACGHVGYGPHPGSLEGILACSATKASFFFFLPCRQPPVL